MTERVLSAERLENGVELSIADESNRYFGDFYRVHLVATIRVLLADALLERAFVEPAQRLKMRQVYGEFVEQRRVLSRMGVAGPDVAAVKQELIGDFLAATRRYMSGADFPVSFLRRKAAERSSNQAFYVPTHR